ncbi:MAG: hypothetical protein NDI77_00390 [Geobacteraceae bacterium]|nr:hypothetical protein [Geobacteraceae bacterium]
MKNDAAMALTMLMIDDDERYVDALFRDAQRHGIFLLHAASLEEGREILEGEKGAEIAGVILDVECYRRRDEETPDSSFIIAATKYFTERAPHLPLAAITGVQHLYDRYLKDFSGIWRVYKKGRDEGEMFARLRGEALELEWVRIAGRYPDVFRVVNEHLGPDARQELLDCLRTMEETSLPRIRGNLANLRSIQERIYIVLQRRRPDMVPRRFITYRDGESEIQSVNLAQILDHLKGSYDPKSQQNRGEVFLHYRSTLYRFSEMIYKVSSDGIHAIDEDSQGKPTRYTVQAVQFALFDLILWFENVVS